MQAACASAILVKLQQSLADAVAANNCRIAFMRSSAVPAQGLGTVEIGRSLGYQSKDDSVIESGFYEPKRN
jgi:hypothetical protein